MKLCKGCNLSKSLTYFNKDKREKDGFNSRCRECINKRRNNTIHEVLIKSKICSICNIEKDITYFKKQKENADGLYHMCKYCFNEWRKEYRKKDYVKQKEKNFRIENQKYYTEYDIKWKELNKDKVKEYQKISNSKQSRKDYQKNFSKINQKKRRERDIIFRLSGNVRNYIRLSLKNKNNKSSVDILGCSFSEYRKYLESKFEPWMNWENYGKYNGDLNYGWDIDHIIPLSTASTTEELLELVKYTNTQPLCSYTNRHIKRSRVI